MYILSAATFEFPLVCMCVEVSMEACLTSGNACMIRCMMKCKAVHMA